MKHSSLIRNLFLLLFVLVPFSLYASVDFPETPAGGRAKEVLDLLNGSSSHSPEDYVKNDYAPSFRDAFPMASHVAIFSTTQGLFGKLQLVEIAKSAPHGITAIFKSASREAYLKLELDVEPEEPHRIALMGISPAGKPANIKETTKEEKAALKRQPPCSIQFPTENNIANPYTKLIEPESLYGQKFKQSFKHSIF